MALDEAVDVCNAHMTRPSLAAASAPASIPASGDYLPSVLEVGQDRVIFATSILDNYFLLEWQA